jgi:hypothetical protein
MRGCRDGCTWICAGAICSPPSRNASSGARSVTLPRLFDVVVGQFEYLERAQAKLRVVVPFTLLVIFVLLYSLPAHRRGAGIMATLPFALIGGFWFIYLLGHDVSIATAVGFIALAGVAAEFGVVMLIYLKHAWEDAARVRATHVETLDDAIREGACLRVRPKAMTVSVIVAACCRSCGATARARGHAAHRGADDRRHDHCAAAFVARDSRRVSIPASTGIAGSVAGRSPQLQSGADDVIERARRRELLHESAALSPSCRATAPGVGVSRYFMSERVASHGRVCVARLTRDFSRETRCLDALGLWPQARSCVASPGHRRKSHSWQPRVLDPRRGRPCDR